ncbi:MAG TPA: hypothetical protein VMB05_18360, partial [Solirubrobacteraceae bacterium]|nr:hypothetical protein [Solirubrobacteraceae bacterium]
MLPVTIAANGTLRYPKCWGWSPQTNPAGGTYQVDNGLVIPLSNTKVTFEEPHEVLFSAPSANALVLYLATGENELDVLPDPPQAVASLVAASYLYPKTVWTPSTNGPSGVGIVDTGVLATQGYRRLLITMGADGSTSNPTGPVIYQANSDNTLDQIVAGAALSNTSGYRTGWTIGDDSQTASWFGSNLAGYTAFNQLGIPTPVAIRLKAAAALSTGQQLSL